MNDSVYIILYEDNFSRIPLYTYISFNGPTNGVHVHVNRVQQRECIKRTRKLKKSKHETRLSFKKKKKYSRKNDNGQEKS